MQPRAFAETMVAEQNRTPRASWFAHGWGQTEHDPGATAVRVLVGPASDSVIS
jgi:hypothetical protein